MAAERFEAALAARSRSGEFGRDENRAPQRLAQSLDAGDFVDGGTDDGEVEPIGRADIAVKHFPVWRARSTEATGTPAAARAVDPATG